MKSTELFIDTDYTHKNIQELNNFDQHLSSLYETHGRKPKFNYPPVFLRDKEEMVSQNLWSILSRNIINPFAPKARIFNYKKFLPEKASPLTRNNTMRKHRDREPISTDNLDYYSDSSKSNSEDLNSPEKSTSQPLKNKSILKHESNLNGRRENDKKVIKLQMMNTRSDNKTPVEKGLLKPLTIKRHLNANIDLNTFFEEAKRQRNKSETHQGSGLMYDPNEINGGEDQTIKRAKDIFESISNENDQKEIKRRLTNIKNKLKSIFVMTQGLNVRLNKKTNPQEIKEITNTKLNEWGDKQRKLLDGLKKYNSFLSRRKSCTCLSTCGGQTEKMHKFANIFTMREVEIIKYNYSHPDSKPPFLITSPAMPFRRTSQMEKSDRLSIYTGLGKKINQEINEKRRSYLGDQVSNKDGQEGNIKADLASLEGNILNDLISAVLIALESTGKTPTEVKGNHDSKKQYSKTTLSIRLADDRRRKSKILMEEPDSGSSEELEMLNSSPDKLGSNKSIPPTPSYRNNEKVAVHCFGQSIEPEFDSPQMIKIGDKKNFKSKLFKQTLINLISPKPSGIVHSLSEKRFVGDSLKEKTLNEAKDLVCSFSSRAKPFFLDSSNELMAKKKAVIYRKSLNKGKDILKKLLVLQSDRQSDRQNERNMLSIFEDSRSKTEMSSKISSSMRKNVSMMKMREHELDNSISIKSFNEEKGNATELPSINNKNRLKIAELKKKSTVNTSLPYLYNLYSKKGK